MKRQSKIIQRQGRCIDLRREARLRQTPRNPAGAWNRSRRPSHTHRMPASELLPHLCLLGVEERILRPASSYSPKAGSLDKQLRRLIDHLLVRYPVPPFMYQALLPSGGCASKQETFSQWFVTIAQGGSFRRQVQPVMTARQAAVFLSAPADGRVNDNVWWAKMTVAGVPEAVTKRLIDGAFRHWWFDDPDPRPDSAIAFFARCHSELDETAVQEVLDFLVWQFRHDATFSLKGRTANSVVRLAGQWHREIQGAKLHSAVRWQGLRIADWSFETDHLVWHMKQLHTNRELSQEGRKQKNCVYSYVDRCAGGRCALFSLRAYQKAVADTGEDTAQACGRTGEWSRVTVEVDSSRTLLQARGRKNRALTRDEVEVVVKWARETGIAVP